MWAILRLIFNQLITWIIVQGFEKSKFGQNLVKKITNLFNKFTKKDKSNDDKK